MKRFLLFVAAIMSSVSVYLLVHMRAAPSTEPVAVRPNECLKTIRVKHWISTRTITLDKDERPGPSVGQSADNCEWVKTGFLWLDWRTDCHPDGYQIIEKCE